MKGRPRVVVYFRAPEESDGADYRVVHTGARYEAQEADSSDPWGWSTVDPSRSFSLLASLLDPEDTPRHALIEGDPEDA